MITMQENLLLRNIAFELQYVPSEYLKALFEIIHAFRLNLPQVVPANQPQNVVDWDLLLDEIMQNRQQNNQKMFDKVDYLHKQ